MTSSAHLQGFFNWSLSYRTDATFPVPYGEVRATCGHPSGDRLHKIIKDFGSVFSDFDFDVHQYSQYSEKTPTSAFTLKNLLYNILTKLPTAIKTLFADQTDH